MDGWISLYNISFLDINEFMLLIIRLGSELKLQAVRLTPLIQRGRLAVSMLTSEHQH